ncbi:MAG TPA: hypothetical protein PKC67_11075 [Kiritimatiellia bacterium]|mgnify:FL=1|nr:hypothetical protein [Kiritimatiellia bacterium]HMP34882.1 hypothetical protein [Kiritimatiellia bacterium]
MGWLREETAYERRMRELDEEAERIRKNMQMLMKQTTRDPVARPVASTGLRKRSSVTPSQRVSAETWSETGDDALDQPVDPSIEGMGPAATDPGDRSLGFGGVASSSPKPEKLANYLASGSFGKAGSLSRERKILRNKAIFMAVVAALALFSLFTWWP